MRRNKEEKYVVFSCHSFLSLMLKGASCYCYCRSFNLSEKNEKREENIIEWVNERDRMEVKVILEIMMDRRKARKRYDGNTLRFLLFLVFLFFACVKKYFFFPISAVVHLGLSFKGKKKGNFLLHISEYSSCIKLQ